MFLRRLVLSIAAVAAVAVSAPMVMAQGSWPYQPYRPVWSPTIYRVTNYYPPAPPSYYPPTQPVVQPPVQPPAATGYLVKFKLFGAVQQQVFNDHQHAHEFEERLAGLGVASQMLHGNGVYAVRYSCPLWKAVEMPDHEHAHELEEWLTSIGFDVYVKH